MPAFFFYPHSRHKKGVLYPVKYSTPQVKNSLKFQRTQREMLLTAVNIGILP